MNQPQNGRLYRPDTRPRRHIYSLVQGPPEVRLRTWREPFNGWRFIAGMAWGCALCLAGYLLARWLLEAIL